MAKLDELLVYLKEHDGSDLHLTAGLEPRIRVKGKLGILPDRGVVSDGDVRVLMREIATEKVWNEFESTHDVDFAYGLQGIGRFRVNYFEQQRGAGAVFRIIPEEIVGLEKLNLPDAIGTLADLDQGLVLVTGPTGSGKSTTLAAIVNRINKTHVKHIVTIEDPVEFVHRSQGCLFSHREVGLHTLGFAPALRAAIRQDADVVLVGEMRERETIALAITAAEMGLLVFATLHTSSAAKAIDRIIDVFPAEEQNMVRMSLSESLAAIVAQLLVPTADGSGRVAANEILMRSSGLPNVIREGNTPMLYSIIQAGGAQGMQAMDDVLFKYVQDGRISAHDAYMKATEKGRFEPLLGPSR